MAAAAPPPPTGTPPETIEIWEGYAKDRYESAAKRIDELRNWARQLAAATAVVIGIELTLTGRILDLKPPFDVALRNGCLLVFLVAVLLQSILLFWTLHIGYVGRTILGPERPSILADYVLGRGPDEVRQVLGAYYATAYDNFFTFSEELSKKVSVTTRVFAFSILLPLAGFASLVVLTWSPEPTRYNPSVMAEPVKTTPQPTPTPSPTTPQTPTPQPPADKSPAPSNPLMNKPTPGQPMTEDFKGKIHNG